MKHILFAQDYAGKFGVGHNRERKKDLRVGRDGEFGQSSLDWVFLLLSLDLWSTYKRGSKDGGPQEPHYSSNL
jgi:hypothetical protein